MSRSSDSKQQAADSHDAKAAAAAVVAREPLYKVTPLLVATTDKREIGNEAVWTLSTAKPGNGVEQLRDDNVDTFWQSDGPQPHLINIQFHKKAKIKELALYLDYKLDESYTPAVLSVRAGMGGQELQEVQLLELVEPCGWVTIPLAPPATADPSDGGTLRCHLLQLCITQSHQNGRDTHVRQCKVFAPRLAETAGLGTALSHFSSIEFQQFASIR